MDRGSIGPISMRHGSDPGACDRLTNDVAHAGAFAQPNARAHSARNQLTDIGADHEPVASTDAGADPASHARVQSGFATQPLGGVCAVRGRPLQHLR